MSPAFKPSVPCPVPGCPNATESGGPCYDCYDRRKRAHEQTESAEERGYTAGWAEEFLSHHPLCAHRVPGRCKGVSKLADHYPRSRKDLAAQGVSDADLNNWEYLVPTCEPCHRYMTSQRQPGGFNRPGWKRSA